MRKSAIVIGFGAFFVTMALLLKFYAYPNLAVIPKDQNTGQTLSDPDAYFFNANTLKFNRGELVTKLAVVVNKELTKKAGGNTLVIDQWQYSNTPVTPPRASHRWRLTTRSSRSTARPGCR